MMEDPERGRVKISEASDNMLQTVLNRHIVTMKH